MAAAGPQSDIVAPPSAQRQALAFQVVVRTRYYDDYLQRAVTGGCRQVVLLAARLDTRAFRLPWPAGTNIFEADLPELLEVKERVLADAGAKPRCQRNVVDVDLRDDWLTSLRDAGFDAAQPTAWLVEGLLVYLENDDARALLQRVSGASAPGSRLAFERSAKTRDVSAMDTASVTGLWRGGVGEDVEDWLAAQGWTVTVDNLGAVASAYGRPPSRPTTSGFVRAVR